MRKAMIIGALLLVSCQSNNTTPSVPATEKQVVKEVVYVPTLMDCDSMESELQLYKEGYQRMVDSMQVQNAKLYRVKFYLGLCMKNPKQDKFLKGWVRRAIE